MKLLPIGISTFEELITNGYIYVDKTAYIYRMITSSKYFFLSRPRRFGKSLTVSTLEALFSGKKELFKNLAISKKDYSWPTHPVVVLDMSAIDFQTPADFKKNLEGYLDEIGYTFDIDLSHLQSPGIKLRRLITTLAKSHDKIVLLIDEYDKPINHFIDQPESANQVRDVLGSFYDVIKSLDRNLKFVFVTGVSKFTKTSIFSALNNLNDISLDERYSAIVGYTKNELAENFEYYIDKLAQKFNIDPIGMINELIIWYDGYRFYPSSDPLFSPQTVLMALDTQKLKNFWFQTASPSFLLKIIKRYDFPLIELHNAKLAENELDPGDIAKLTLPSILFQTGYLTIKSYDTKSKNFLLDFPNEEVSQSFTQYVATELAHKTEVEFNDLTIELKQALATGKTEQFLTILYNFIASIPYYFESERSYQTIIYAVLKLIGAQVIVEDPTNRGRIDASISTSNFIYLIEIKKKKSATIAMDQIMKKEYFRKFLNEKKKIILIGLTFDINARNLLKPWSIKELSK